MGVEGAQQLGHVGAVAGQPHAVGQLVVGQPGADLGQQRPAAHQRQAHRRGHRAVEGQQLEGLQQQQWVLDVGQPAHVADHWGVGRPAGGRAQGGERVAGVGAGRAGGVRGGGFRRVERPEALGVHAVRDRRDPLGRHAHALAQVVAGGLGQRHLLVHEAAHQPAGAQQARVPFAQVVHLPAVLAVHAGRHAGGPGGQLRFQRADVAGVDQVGLQLAQQPPDSGQVARQRAGLALERNDLDLGVGDALGDRPHAGERHDGVPVALRRQRVHQVDQAVLHAAGVQAMDDVDQVGGNGGHRRGVR